MSPRRREARRRLSALFVLVIALAAGSSGAVLGSASPASAHNVIVSTSPAEGETVTEQPGQIVITTSDALLDLGDAGNANQIQVTGPGDQTRYYASACAATNGPALVAPVQLGEAGKYTVTWQLVSADGHPVSGSYVFTWQPGTGEQLADGTAEPACATSGAVARPDVSAEPGGSSGSPGSSAPSDGADVWWIVGAIGILVIAGVAVLVVMRRKPGGA